MGDIPDKIVLKRDRDLEGRAHYIWYRRAIIALLGVFIVLGLLNVFGQRPHTETDGHAKATMELNAPEHLRGGLLYQARFTIHAHQDVKSAVLELSPGWVESQTLNTVVPSPLAEGNRNGNILFTLGHIPAGTIYHLFLQFQVNPTNVGHRSADVTLYDGGTKLAHIDRDLSFFP